MSRRDHAKTLNSRAAFTLLENVRAPFAPHLLVESSWNSPKTSTRNVNPKNCVAFFLTAVMVPVLSVVIVAGYGFIVWASQLLSGPPTH